MRGITKGAALVTAVSLLFTSGCSYISTMDPNDNSRLEALKEESRKEILKEGSGMTLKAFQQKVESLKTPRLIFKTRLEGEELIVEAFTNPDDIQGTLDAVFSDEKELLQKVRIVNGKRGEKDFLPKGLLPDDPDGMIFHIFLESSGGQLHDMTTTTLEKGSNSLAEKLNAELRQLMLVGETLPKDAEGTFYRLQIMSEGKYRGDLILDNNQSLHVVTEDGAVRSYLLMNLSQWSSLKRLLDGILHMEPELPDDPSVENPDTMGFNLPWGNEMAITSDATHFIRSEKDPSRNLYLQSAMVGKISDDHLSVISEDRYFGIWLAELAESEDGSYYLESHRRIELSEAEVIADELGYQDDLADLISRLDEEARFQFLLQARGRWLSLDSDR